MTLKVIHWLQAFSNAISRTFVQHFTRLQLTMCSHSPSALAELLVLSLMRYDVSGTAEARVVIQRLLSTICLDTIGSV